jgi:hypothetical protein
MRRRITPKQLALLEETLTPRERDVISTLDRLRLATTEQLRRICFAGLTRGSAARQAPALLGSLAERQVVVKLARQVGGVRAGSRAAVWSLDTAGQRLASACGPAGGRALRQPWTPSLAFLAHRLAVSDCFAGLMERVHAREIDLLDFDAEPLSWRRYASPYGGTQTLKPDVFVRLGVAGVERGSFVEIDRSTESRPTLAKKLRVYRTFWETGREQHRRGYYPSVVFAVPDEDRKAALLEVFEAQPEDSQPLWRVTLAANLIDHLIEGGS